MHKFCTTLDGEAEMEAIKQMKENGENVSRKGIDSLKLDRLSTEIYDQKESMLDPKVLENLERYHKELHEKSVKRTLNIEELRSKYMDSDEDSEEEAIMDTLWETGVVTLDPKMVDEMEEAGVKTAEDIRKWKKKRKLEKKMKKQTQQI